MLDQTVSSEQLRGIVNLIGVGVQAAGSLLLLLLFALLQRRAGREFFAQWATALGLTVLGAGVVLARHLFLGPAGAWPAPDTHALVQALYALHQFCKLGALVLFLSGAAQYAQVTLPSNPRRLLLGAAAVAALGPIAAGGDLTTWMIWLAPVAVVAHAWAGWLLAGAPEASRGLGTRVSAGAFMVDAAFWALFAVCFPLADAAADGGSGAIAAMVVQYQSYGDFLVTVILAFGMVVALLEEASGEVEAGKRRVDEAHQSLARAHDRLRRLALYDPLTGCLNRQGFAERHGRAAASPSLKTGTVLVVDMDNLKPTNDSFGHDAGDAMLRYLARTLQGRAPAGTTIYRWGGDEFLLIVPDMKPAEAQAHFAKAVLEAPQITPPGAPHPLTLEASVGAAQFRNPGELDDAIKRADRGMYVQKQGRKLRDAAPAASLA